jgi:hypothetical protein
LGRAERDCLGEADQGLVVEKKIALIRASNPTFRDLSEGFSGSQSVAIKP